MRLAPELADAELTADLEHFAIWLELALVALGLGAFAAGALILFTFAVH